VRNGDLVRFREREVHYDMGGAIEGIGPWSIGLLVEYHPWEKIASILFEGRIIRVAASDVQLYRYRLGYIDGYSGRDPSLLDDTTYMRGYQEGVEDDSTGSLNRFPEECLSS
jgi:hypothetical protein